MAVDYDAIIANAMTNQSPDLCPGAALPDEPDRRRAGRRMTTTPSRTCSGSAMTSKAPRSCWTTPASWTPTATAGASYNGQNLPFNACCPNGWTDWMAAMEIVAAAGKKIGIDITTDFPEWSVYQTVVTSRHAAARRLRHLHDVDRRRRPDPALGPHPHADELRVQRRGRQLERQLGRLQQPPPTRLIKAIPAETDAAKLKEILHRSCQDLPDRRALLLPDVSPAEFHAVNECVWTELSRTRMTAPTRRFRRWT